MSELGVKVRAAHVDDAAALVKVLRQADRDELQAIGSTDFQGDIEKSIAGSVLAFSSTIDGEIACIFGVGGASLIGGTAVVWCLSADIPRKHRRVFAKGSVWWRDYFLARFPVMMNAIDDRNIATKRWLKWLGASFAEPAPAGPDGRMFTLFELRASHV